MSTILYNDKPEIGIPELGHIYLALITSADKIFINRNVKVSTLIPKEQLLHIEDSLGTLLDNKLVQLWTYPHEIPSQSSYDLMTFPDKDYVLWQEIIKETFLKGEKLSSIFSLIDNDTNKKNIVEERTSKIVAIRKEYWAFATCSALKLDQILNSYGSWEPDYLSTEAYDFTKLQEPLISKLFSRYGIPDLSVLSGDDVVKLNRKNDPFIRTIKDKVGKVSEKVSDIEAVEVAYDEIIGELLQILDANISSRVKMISTGLFWNTAGLLLAPLSFIPSVNDFIDELSNRRKFGFLYFMSKIKKAAGKRTLKQ